MKYIILFLLYIWELWDKIFHKDKPEVVDDDYIYPKYTPYGGFKY